MLVIKEPLVKVQRSPKMSQGRIEMQGTAQARSTADQVTDD